MRRLGLALLFCLIAVSSPAQWFGCQPGFCNAGIVIPVVPPTGMKSPVIIDPQAQAPSTSAAQFISVAGGGWSAAASNKDQPWPKSGSFKNLTVNFPTTITQGTYTIAFAVNGSVAATPLTCQLTTSTNVCTDTTHEIIFSAGDRLSWRVTPAGTPTAQSGQVKIAALFTSYGSDGAISTAHISSPSNSAPNYMTAGSYAATAAAWQATETQASGIIPTSGTLDSLYVTSGVAPGAATSFTFTLYLNGVSQGSSACAISGASATSCSVTGLSIAVVAGDLVSTEAVPSGTPSAAFTPRISIGWTPTTVGEALQITATGALAGGSTRFVSYIGPSGGTATEANTLVIAPSVFTIKLLRVIVAPALTGANIRVHILRQGTGGGQSNQLVTCTLSVALPTACNDSSNSYTSTLNDFLNWASGGATSPVTTSYKFSSVMYTP